MRYFITSLSMKGLAPKAFKANSESHMNTVANTRAEGDLPTTIRLVSTVIDYGYIFFFWEETYD